MIPLLNISVSESAAGSDPTSQSTSIQCRAQDRIDIESLDTQQKIQIWKNMRQHFENIASSFQSNTVQFWKSIQNMVLDIMSDSMNCLQYITVGEEHSLLEVFVSVFLYVY